LLYFDMAHSWFSKGQVENARISLTKAIRAQPVNLRYYVMYALTLLQPNQAIALRNAWRRMRGEALS